MQSNASVPKQQEVGMNKLLEQVRHDQRLFRRMSADERHYCREEIRAATSLRAHTKEKP